MEQVPTNSTIAKRAILEFSLLGDVRRSLIARSDPGTVKIVYVDSVRRSVHKQKNRWVLESGLQAQASHFLETKIQSHMLEVYPMDISAPLPRISVLRPAQVPVGTKQRQKTLQ